MNDFLTGVLGDYLAAVTLLLTLAILAYYDKRHPEFRHNLESWRNWAKGPDSWVPYVMIPVVLTILAYVGVTGSYWGVYVAASILFVYTHFSLPGVVNLKTNPIVLSGVTVTARVTVVPAPTRTILGRKIPNHRYLKYKWDEYRTRKNL